MKENNEKCCSISNEEINSAIQSQCPNLLKKFNFDPVAFHNEIERLIPYVCKNSINVLSMMAIIDLLNNGDIPGELQQKAQSNIVLKISEDGTMGLFTFLDGKYFKYAIGTIPNELWGKVKVGDIIDSWSRPSCFASIDSALKAFKKMEKEQ